MIEDCKVLISSDDPPKVLKSAEDKVLIECGCNYSITEIGDGIVPGTSDIGNHVDDEVTTIALPFPFTLYDQTFNTVTLSSNGNAQFVGDLTDYGPDCLPVTDFQYTIFVHQRDQRTDCGGCGIFTSITGSSPNRIFNIEWRVADYSETGFGNFELRLYENGFRFDIIYGSFSMEVGEATAGVQSGDCAYKQLFCAEGGNSPSGAHKFVFDDTINCPDFVGACCVLGVCTDVTQEDCEAVEGYTITSWRGCGTACEDIHCGACCDQFGECRDNWYESGFGNCSRWHVGEPVYFQGDGTTCALSPQCSGINCCYLDSVYSTLQCGYFSNFYCDSSGGQDIGDCGLPLCPTCCAPLGFESCCVAEGCEVRCQCYDAEVAYCCDGYVCSNSNPLCCSGFTYPECCPADWQCCLGNCCPGDYTCCSDGSCCSPEHPVCNPGGYCTSTEFADFSMFDDAFFLNN